MWEKRINRTHNYVWKREKQRQNWCCLDQRDHWNKKTRKVNEYLEEIIQKRNKRKGIKEISMKGKVLHHHWLALGCLLRFNKEDDEQIQIQIQIRYLMFSTYPSSGEYNFRCNQNFSVKFKIWLSQRQIFLPYENEYFSLCK